MFLKVGMNVQWDAQMSVQEMVNEGVRRAYTHPDNVLRASVLADPAGKRQNTKDKHPPPSSTWKSWRATKSK